MSTTHLSGIRVVMLLDFNVTCCLPMFIDPIENVCIYYFRVIIHPVWIKQVCFFLCMYTKLAADRKFWFTNEIFIVILNKLWKRDEVCSCIYCRCVGFFFYILFGADDSMTTAKWMKNSSPIEEWEMKKIKNKTKGELTVWRVVLQI